MPLTRAEKTQLGVLKTKQESSDTFGPLTPKEQKTLEELEQKQGNQSSLFDNLGIFSTAQASEINPNNPPSMLSTGAMDRETPFGDILQPTIPSGGSIFSGREFGDIRAGKEDQGIFGGSAGQRFNIENNPELFFNTAAGQTKTDEEQDFFDYLQNLSGGAVDFGKDLAGRYIASNIGATTLGSFNPYLGAAAGIAGLFGGGNMFDRSQSQMNFDNLSPEAQAYTSSLYGRQRDGTPGLLEGYNQISARGVGALGTLQNRLGNIQNRKAPQTPYSINLSNQIQNAIDNIISDKDKKAGMNAPNNIGLGGGNSGSGDSDAGYSPGQSAGMGFGGGRSDPTDKR